ncbi:MAG: cation diffusion facilitator family transporter, partial [Nitrospirota bacterium]|nr:cation diffusion facilitator family transporter [Nitrospirota bacterium]
IVTMGINIFVTRWERRKGTELKSDILTADSYHTASDVLTSSSVLVGLLAVQAGYAFIDPLVAVLIACIIAWTAFVVLKDVLSSLTDAIRLDPEEVRTAVMSISGVLDCHDIRTRGLAHHVFMDLSIHVDPTLSVEKAHTLATRIEELLIAHFESLEDVVVHIEPEGH